MGKMLAGVIVGVFVGAAVFEILNRRHPNLLRDVEDKAKGSTRRAMDAFSDGYKRPRRMKAARVVSEAAPVPEAVVVE
jgi:hypothetical protein